MDGADLVGWIVVEREDGYYNYGCAEHTPEEIKEQTHRQVLRVEAEDEGATCVECGISLAELEAVDR